MAWKHDWKIFEHRFVILREWLSFEEMSRSLKEEFKDTRKKAPAPSLIRKRAAAEKWMEKRLEQEQAMRETAMKAVHAKETQKLIEIYEDDIATGNSLLKASKQYLNAKEEAAALARENGDKDAQGAISTTYEALAALRIGAALRRLAAEGIAGGKPKAFQDLDDPEGATVIPDASASPSVILLPAPLNEEQWNKQRRKALEPPKDDK